MILGKGPILHRVEDKQIVRLQAASLTKPAVEWRKESSEPPHKEEMKPAGSALQVEHPRGAQLAMPHLAERHERAS